MAQFLTTPSVTIVIPVWNQWAMTRACLESLRPTLGGRDTVVVVDNGSQDATGTGLKQFPWAKVITNEENRGFAVACNQGAAIATSDVVVFLNNDTLLPSRWLEGLITPFASTDVAATGPRSNFVSGPQLVDSVDYQYGSMSSLRRFAKSWREAHRGQTTDTTRLIGFCLAVRRSALEAVGGFDEGFGTGGFEDDDLCLRLVNNGGRLVICHESFVHHHGHATFDANGLDWFAIQNENLDRFRSKHLGGPVAKRRTYSSDSPLISACMIVKDEEDNLPKCLASLAGFVDEVVIYDTGSTDRTKEIALAAGARVIDGYWDDDFGRARNASLDQCSGEWALQIDADEVIEGDAQQFRDTLINSTMSAFQVEIENLSVGNRSNLRHRPCRVFKRNQHHWVGRLHEQVVTRAGAARFDYSLAPHVRLIHSGYLPEAMAHRNKAERNIRLAQAEIDTDDGRDSAEKLTNLGRSYTLAGRHEEALALFTQARAMGSDNPVIRRGYLRAGAQSTLTVGRPEETLIWANEMSATSQSQDTARYLRGAAMSDLRRWEETLDALEGLTSITDDDGVVFPITAVLSRRGLAYASLERWSEAASELEPLVTVDSHEEPIWGLLIESFWQAGRGAEELVRIIPPVHLTAVFAQLTHVSPGAADAVLEALYGDTTRQSSVLALAIRVAPHLDVERQMTWSMRLRNVNLAEHCPLIATAWNTTVSARQRLISAIGAHISFRDERALGGLRFAASALSEDDFGDILVYLNELAPELLEPFIVAATTKGSRSFAMARALHGLGASDEAVVILMHGLASAAGGELVSEAADWLDSVGHGLEANSLRQGLHNIAGVADTAGIDSIRR